MPECPVCSAKFSLNKNLYQHMRRKHSINPHLVGKLNCPLECADAFRVHKELRNHLETVHKLLLESEVVAFPDFATFEIWKKNLETTSGFGYITRNSEKVLRKGGDLKSHYICHRSGVYKSESSGQRKCKKVGSCKIGTTCPSVMEVSRSSTDGTVIVVFWKTHIGHDADIEMTPVRKGNHSKKSGMISSSVCAIIPAAGIGERMGVDMPKQFIPIHQKPIICYTVEAFLRLPFVQKVIVVASSDNLDLMLETLRQGCRHTLQGEKLMVTEGSGSRHQSIKSGLTALQTCCTLEPDVVVIHDGVRPFFPEDTVCEVVKAARDHGAAGVTCPLVSTVISVDEEGFLDTSLDRSKFKASETPQAFQYDVICKAYEESSEHDLEYGTECLQLVQKYVNIQAKLIPANSHLWKVTYRKDIHACSAVLKENQNVAICNNSCASEILPFLKIALCKTFKSVQVIGKFNESLLVKFPNIVQMHDDKNPYDSLEQLNILTSGDKLSQLTSIVHVLHDYDSHINFVEFQKEAKITAKKLKMFNVLLYYVVLWNEGQSIEDYEEVADLLRSLLFDSNPNISGSVILS